MRRRGCRGCLLAFLIFAAVLILFYFIITVFVLGEKPVRPKNAEDLIHMDYYDYSNQNIVFQLPDQELHSADIDTLRPEEYEQFGRCDLEIRYVYWADHNTAIIRSEKTEHSGSYFYLDSGENEILMIPTEKIISWPEPLRPLAFYLTE